jgi:antitoxin VapB
MAIGIGAETTDELMDLPKSYSTRPTCGSEHQGQRVYKPWTPKLRDTYAVQSTGITNPCRLLQKPREYPLMILVGRKFLVHLFFVARNGPVSCEKFQLKQSLVIGPILADVFGICWEVAMAEQRHVRIFRNGRNQAVRIPVEFELPVDEAIMHRDGDRLVIEPVRKRRLVALLKAMKPLDEDFPEIDDPVPTPERVL